MLPLASFQSGFYHCDIERQSVPVVPVGELTTWESGKKLVGQSARGRLLTDGTDGVTFAGCQLLPEWDEREGYRVVPAIDLSNYIFTSNRVEVFFIEPFVTTPARVQGGYTLPAKVALREADIPAGLVPPLPATAYRLPMPKLCAAIAQGIHGVEFSILTEPRDFLYSGSKGAVRPTRPLTRQEWLTLGGHIPTKDDETLDQVVPILESGFSFPITSVEDLAEYGVTAEIRGAVKGSLHLMPESFVVEDPDKASQLVPFLNYYQAGSSITVSHDNPNARGERGDARFDVQFFDALKPPPLYSHLWQRDVDEIYAEMPKAAIQLNGTRPVLITAARRTVLATKKMVGEYLISARKAQARYQLGELRWWSFHVEVGGKLLDGEYFALDSMQNLPPAGNRQTKAKERRATLQSRHGDLLPPGWEKMSDGKIDKWVAWNKAARDAWISVCEIIKRMSGDEEDALTKEVFWRWLQQVAKWPYVDHPENGETLYAAITAEEIIRHPEFMALLQSLCGDSYQFMRRIMFNETAKQRLASVPIARGA